jgi:hypothetical protein
MFQEAYGLVKFALVKRLCALAQQINRTCFLLIITVASILAGFRLGHLSLHLYQMWCFF